MDTLFKTLMKALNDILEQKENEITLLKWENEKLKEDIEKYKENEANRV